MMHTSRFTSVICNFVSRSMNIKDSILKRRNNEFCGYNLSNLIGLRFFAQNSEILNANENKNGECYKYSDEEMNKILKVLNKSDVNELSRFSMSKMRLKNILDRRKVLGEFETIEDVINMERFSNKSVQKLFDSILCNEVNVKRKEEKIMSKIKGKILEPPLDGALKNNLKSVCSLMIDLSFISWACVERDGNVVRKWDVYHYEDVDAKQLKLSNTLELVWNICQKIPRSDVYIMEAISTVHRASGADANNPKAAHINLQKVQLIAIATAVLNTLENVLVANRRWMILDVFLSLIHLRTCSTTDSPILRTLDSSRNSSIDLAESFILPEFNHKVYYLRPLLASRLFKTYVGQERVSPQSITEAMISDANSYKASTETETTCEFYSDILKNITPINFDEDVKWKYEKVKPRSKEIMSQTLLLASTFMELCVYENVNAIKSLASREK